MEAVIEKAQVCRLGLCEGGQPYIVPLCFGYEDRNLYFHCAAEGKKLDILRRNDKVCFEIDVAGEVVEADEACKFGFSYQSVIGLGRGSIVLDAKSKRRALDVIMQHYAEGEFSYSAEAVDGIVVIRVEIDDMTGKESGG